MQMNFDTNDSCVNTLIVANFNLLSRTIQGDTQRFELIERFIKDHRSNPKEFPPSFCRGSLEGIWWAFVTMTTVGYGDKAPKFFLARILTVVWMFMGVAVMAYLTAIMATALTSGFVKDHKVIVNKKLGVLAGSQGYSEGIKQGAIVKEYNDLEALSEGLSNSEVEGILLDVFTTNYIANKHPNYSETLEQVRILEFPFSIGIYMVHLSGEDYLWLHHCISDLKIELEINPSLLKYIIASTIQDTESTSWGTRLNLFGPSQVAFQKTLYILLSILAALIAMGLLWELFSRQKRRTLKLREKANKEDAQKENWKQDTLIESGDFRRMMDRISDVEKCLAKISELKAAYNRMDGYSSYQEKYKSTRESSGYENSAYKTSLEMTTSGPKH